VGGDRSGVTDVNLERGFFTHLNFRRGELLDRQGGGLHTVQRIGARHAVALAGAGRAAGRYCRHGGKKWLGGWFVGGKRPRHTIGIGGSGERSLQRREGSRTDWRSGRRIIERFGLRASWPRHRRQRTGGRGRVGTLVGRRFVGCIADHRSRRLPQRAAKGRRCSRVARGRICGRFFHGRRGQGDRRLVRCRHGILRGARGPRGCHPRSGRRLEFGQRRSAVCLPRGRIESGSGGGLGRLGRRRHDVRIIAVATARLAAARRLGMCSRRHGGVQEHCWPTIA